MNFDYFNIILASQSPRRSQLLRESGFTRFDVRPTHTDETIPPQYPTNVVAAYLAEKKASAGAEWLQSEKDLIIAADTIVVLNDKIYGKPESEADAKQILQDLSGQTHQVITGVCLLSTSKKVVFSEVSQVVFDTLSAEEIDFYVNTYKPYDKAGAYAIQEWIGHCKIKRIEGTYSNIMGLPTHRLWQELTNMLP